MKKLSNAFKFSFSKKESPQPTTSNNNSQWEVSPSTRRFSEPAEYFDGESRKSEISDNMPSLFERSIKVMFPKQGSASDYENALRASLVNLPDIVNIGIKDRKAIVLFYTPESCQDALPVLQSSLGSDYKIKRMRSNSTGGERDSMIRSSTSRKNSLTQSPPRVERAGNSEKTDQRNLTTRTKEAPLNVHVAPRALTDQSEGATDPADSNSPTPSGGAESADGKKSIWKSALNRILRSSRSSSVSGGSTLARLQLSGERNVVDPATDSAAPSPNNRDSNVSGLTDNTPFAAMSPSDSIAEPFSPGPARLRSAPSSVQKSKADVKAVSQTWNGEFKRFDSDSDRDEIPAPTNSFIRASMEVRVAEPSDETGANATSAVRVSTHSHLQTLSAKAPVATVSGDSSAAVESGDVIRTSQVSRLRDDESVIHHAKSRAKVADSKSEDVAKTSSNNVVSIASDDSDEFTMADLYSTAAKTVERIKNGEKVDSAAMNNSRFSLVLSDALKRKPAAAEKDSLELLHEQEKVAHHRRLGIHMVHTEHLLPLREPGPDSIPSPQTTNPTGALDDDQDNQSHLSEKMSHYSQMGRVFRRSPSGRSMKGGAGRGAGLIYSHSAKKPGATSTGGDPNMSPMKPTRDTSEYQSPSPNSREKSDFPFSPFTITKEDLAAMRAAEENEISPVSVSKAQQQVPSVTPKPDKPNRSRSTSTDDMFSPSQFLNPDESLLTLSQYAISPVTEEKRLLTGSREQDQQSPSISTEKHRADAEVQVEIEATNHTEEVSKLRLMVQVLEAQAKVRCRERAEAEAEFDERNRQMQAKLAQSEEKNRELLNQIASIQLELRSVTDLANKQQSDAEAETRRHNEEMRQFEANYEACTTDWEVRLQQSEARVSTLTQELAAVKGEQQRVSDGSTQLNDAVEALTAKVTELTAASDVLSESLRQREDVISRLESTVTQLTEEKSILATQIESLVQSATLAAANTDTASQAQAPESAATVDAAPVGTSSSVPNEPSTLPSLKPSASPSSSGAISGSTHVFHYVPTDYADQSWSEYIPPTALPTHPETYHHVYHAPPPPRFTSPSRYPPSHGVSSTMTARELATLMARSSTRPSSRYASPVRRSYASEFVESTGVSQLDEIRMKLDILKSLTNQKIASQRVVRSAGPGSTSVNEGLMSYYDNLRASLDL